jgi:hypothetical protein
MQRTENKEFTPPLKSAKAVLISNILLNLGILALFKYYNFFAINFVSAFASVGIYLQPATLNIILPVGISSKVKEVNNLAKVKYLIIYKK